MCPGTDTPERSFKGMHVCVYVCALLYPCSPFQAARYHSLVIKKDTLPEDLEVTAWTEDGTIMAVRHKKHPHIQGVQFHPESIITQNGMKIVENFVKALPSS